MKEKRREFDLKQMAQHEIEATFCALPPRLREQAMNIPVVLENTPNQKLVQEGVESDTLGLFVGEAFPDSASGVQQLPAQIILYIDNIWDYAENDRETYRLEIRRTLLHELGHYLGLEEDDLEQRDLD